MDIDLIKQCLLTARNKKLRKAYGWTPIHAAVASGKRRKVKKLLRKNKKLVNASNRDGWTPLHVVVGLSGYSDIQKALCIIRELTKAGAECSARNKDGLTPMHVAAALHHDHTASIMQTLATKSENYVVFFPEARDGKGRTALHIAAAKNKCLKVVSILCERGYDLNAQDGAGNTPLHKAAAKENLQIVRLLLARGANPWLRNGKGQLPRDLAEQNKKLRNILAAP